MEGKNTIRMIIVMIAAIVLVPLIFMTAWNCLIANVIGAGFLGYTESVKVWLGLVLMRWCVGGFNTKSPTN